MAKHRGRGSTASVNQLPPTLTRSRPALPGGQPYGIPEGLRRTGRRKPLRHRDAENNHKPAPGALAQDVPVAVMPFAAPLQVARREGCSLRTDTAAAVSETTSDRSLQWMHGS